MLCCSFGLLVADAGAPTLAKRCHCRLLASVAGMLPIVRFSVVAGLMAQCQSCLYCLKVEHNAPRGKALPSWFWKRHAM